MAMLTTDAEIEAAIERGKALPKAPLATEVQYIAQTDQVAVVFDNAIEVRFPRATFTEVTFATVKQISRVEIVGGDALRWEAFDADYYLPNMLDGFGDSCRVFAELGRRGGAKKSPAKTAAVRANGKKGGRPKKRDRALN